MGKRKGEKPQSANLFGASEPVRPEPGPLPDIAPLRPTAVYNSYWRFAAERQLVFFRRLEGWPPPWTEDPVLLAHKFTNAYRASDRVSQYLIRRVIYRHDLPDDPVETVFRILLFKLFNRIETWELLERSVGPLTYAGYSFKRYDRVLSRAMDRGDRIYSAAYIMPSAGTLGHDRKHRNHLTLIERMLNAELPARLVEAGSMGRAFELIRAYPTIGDFLAYQYVTDINYSTVTDFDEMEFVVPGPGSTDGIRKCFANTGRMSDPDVIRFMADRQEAEFARLGIEFRSLWGRRLQLIDCQNLFCEVDKYARVMHPEITGVTGRTRIKQKFRANPEPIEYWYPPKWAINKAIAAHPKIGSSAATIMSSTRPEAEMNLTEYQERAKKTDRNPAEEPTDQKAMMIPLLGLAGEAGELLSEYKKYLRDGDTHLFFRERFVEELGDLLWYLSNVATKFGLGLQEIAERNLAKCEQRFGQPEGAAVSDADYPEGERLPRKFEVHFNAIKDGSHRPRMKAYYEGKQFGDDLTDNAYEGDGYRFHDVFHLAFAAVLGWSPITRTLTGKKRRSKPQVDEVEDGGRAKAIEEGISALIFAFGKDYAFLEGKPSVSSELLRTIRSMVSHLEVAACSTGDWEKAIIQGFTVWREITKRHGGTVVVDLDDRSITLLEA
ncbi:MAG: putative DNA base hypermodification protein [Isosphaeraceae bacterium]|nr:putative DNA base hypermodification protein [Isosphaeraceae bacterium]